MQVTLVDTQAIPMERIQLPKSTEIKSTDLRTKSEISKNSLMKNNKELENCKMSSPDDQPKKSFDKLSRRYLYTRVPSVLPVLKKKRIMLLRFFNMKVKSIISKKPF